MRGSFLGQGEREHWRFPSSTQIHPIYSTPAHIAALTQPQIHFDATENAGFSKMSQSWCWGESWWENECSMPSVLWYSSRASPGTFYQWDKDERSGRGLSQPGWWHRSRHAVLSCCKESHPWAALWRRAALCLFDDKCLRSSCSILSSFGCCSVYCPAFKNKDPVRKKVATRPETDIIFSLKFPMSPAKNVGQR